MYSVNLCAESLEKHGRIWIGILLSGLCPNFSKTIIRFVFREDRVASSNKEKMNQSFRFIFRITLLPEAPRGSPGANRRINEQENDWINGAKLPGINLMNEVILRFCSL